jgi:MFS transporter, DHA2 family, methylenomycin A resistance protein
MSSGVRTSAGALAAGPDPVQRRRPGWALVATSLGFGVVQLDVSVVNVAIAPIGADFGGAVAGLQWVVNAYTVGFAALILSAGALGDRIGARRMFVAGFVLFTAASAACGLAPTLPALVAARGLQGVGAAVLVPCALSLLAHAYPEHRARARAVGLWAAGASIAVAAGPLVGGLLIASLGWRSIFFINVPIGLVAIGLTCRHTVETTRSRERGPDVPGQVLAVIALVALTAAMVEAGRRGFADPLVLGGCVVAVAAGAGFVALEARRENPMLPLRLFRSRTFSATSAIGLLVNVAFYGLIFVLSLYFQTTRGWSPLRTGLAFAPTAAAVLVANLTAGRLARAVGARNVLVAAALLMGASLAGLVVVDAGIPYPWLVGQLVTLGLGLGTVVPVMTAALLGSVDTSRSGLASGTLNTARQTGSAIGVALFGSLSAADLVTGLRVALAVSVGLALGVAVLAGLVEDPPST